MVERSPSVPSPEPRNPLTVVFCGTPRFAVPTLDRLIEAGLRVPLVVTQPDKPRGRGMEMSFSPVKQRALELGIPVAQPEKIKTNEQFRKQLAELRAEAIIVVGYGRIIPQWMIEMPALGNLNVHASLLPKYRGAAPMQWAIARGETVTGVTTMRIDAGLDTGDILLQKDLPILPDDTAETLAPRLASLGANLLLETLFGLQDGSIKPRPQDHLQATLAPILKKEDGLINFSRSAVEISNRLRGFQPWPGAYTGFRGKNLQIWSACLETRTLPQGLMKTEGDRLYLGCGHSTSLQILELQLEGKKRIPAKAFIQGYHPDGETLG